MIKELSDGVTETKYCKSFERNSHWRKLSMIMVWERYCYASPKPGFFFIFSVYIFIHISANMSPFGLKFSQMILHTETSKLMYNWSFLFVVLHKPTLLPSTFNINSPLTFTEMHIAYQCFHILYSCLIFLSHLFSPPPPPPDELPQFMNFIVLIIVKNLRIMRNCLDIGGEQSCGWNCKHDQY